MKKNRFRIIALLSFIALMGMTSCSDKEEVQETIFKMHYVEGSFNKMPISINLTNHQVSLDTNYRSYLLLGTGDERKIKFDWRVRLIESQETVVTMYLHIDDIWNGKSKEIYGPNDPRYTVYGLTREDSCRVEVEDLKTGTKTTYYPVGLSVSWNPLIKSYPIKTEQYGDVTISYRQDESTGIVGRLWGDLKEDGVNKESIPISIVFKQF